MAYLMKSMIQTMTACSSFSELMAALPVRAKPRVNAVHDVSHRKYWGLKRRKGVRDFILAYIRGGNGAYHCFQEEQQSVPIEAGRLVLISPDCPHVATQGDQVPDLISLRCDFIDLQSGSELRAPQPFFLSILPDYPEPFARLFDEILRCDRFRQRNESYSRLADAALAHLLHALWVAYEETREPHDDIRLERARRLMDRNLCDPFDLDQIAATTGLSKPWFTRRFRQQYGMTPQTYFYRAKMKLAYLLLTESGLSVKETAHRLGYADAFIFSNQFKRHFGYRPSRAVDF